MNNFFPGFIFAMLLPISAARVALAQNSNDDAPPPVSIVTLLAEPVRTSPHKIQVSGFLVLDFEGEALYLHREDYQEGLSRNAIRLSLSPVQEKRYKDLAGSYVTVEGSFQKRRNSEDIFTGVLFNVQQIRKTLARH